MFCIYTQTKDPWFNLATEEYLLTRSKADYFIIWQSDPVVVCGKHQNILAEINYRLLKSGDIKIARRLSGGGTVYHDEGNINFTFIRTGETGKLVDFSIHIRPVIDFLATLGVTATEGKKHEILVSSKKISGNAEHVYKNRVLHHGTLLLNADISILNGSLKRSGGIYTDKAVQSNRSEVINLNACMKHKMTPPVFCEAMFDYMIAYFNGSQYTMDQDEKNAIEKVADEKYRTWEWIFGWSPDYEFRNTWKNEKGNVEIYLKVHRGMMLTCDIVSDRLSVYCKNLSLLISAGKHEEHTIHYAVRTAMNGILTDREMEDLTYAFF